MKYSVGSIGLNIPLQYASKKKRVYNFKYKSVKIKGQSARPNMSKSVYKKVHRAQARAQDLSTWASPRPPRFTEMVQQEIFCDVSEH